MISLTVDNNRPAPRPSRPKVILSWAVNIFFLILISISLGLLSSKSFGLPINQIEWLKQVVLWSLLAFTPIFLLGIITKRSWWDFFVLTVFRYFMIVFSTVVVSGSVNRIMDPGQPDIVTTLALEKRMSGKPINYEVITDYRANTGDTQPINVSYSQYNSIQPNKSHLRLIIMPGFLRFPWIKSIQVIE